MKKRTHNSSVRLVGERDPSTQAVACCLKNEPYLFTVDFVRDRQARRLWFHCATEGRKMDIIKANPRVCVTVVEDHSRVGRMARKLQLPTMVVLLSALAAVAVLTIAGGPAVLMMLATSTIVLATLIASALLTSRAVLRVVKPV